MKLQSKLRSASRTAGSAVKNGFLHILLGNTLVKLISAVPGIFLNIILSKVVFGQFTYADAIVNYVVLMSGLGISGGILRYCSIAENDGECNGYFQYGLKYGLFVNTALGLIGFAVFHFVPFQYKIYNNLVCALIFYPILAFTFEAIQYYFRATRKNKIFSLTSVVFSLASAVFLLSLSYLFSLTGTVAARYLCYAVAIVVAVLLFRRLPAAKVRAQKLSREKKTGMARYSFWSMLANFFSQIIPINEQNIVNQLLTDPIVSADYKFASILPQATTFVSASVMVFTFPYFAKHYRDGKWLLKNSLRLMAAITAGISVFTVLCVIFTPQIIAVYNKKYLDSVHIMRLMWVVFGIANCVRAPVGNILAAVGEIRFNFLNALFSAIIHFIIGYSAVKAFGIWGAAYGLLTVYALSSVSSLVYLIYYCKKLERKYPASEGKNV